MRGRLRRLFQHNGKNVWVSIGLGVILFTLLGSGAYAAVNIFTQHDTYHPYDQGINRAYWLGLGNGTLSPLTSSPLYPNSPTGKDVLPRFEATDWDDPAITQNWADNYSQRMYGYIVAPETGTYYFWISSDDNGQLSLSTDSTAANAQVIATQPSWSAYETWNTSPNQASVGISLVAGHYYYVEALQSEGGGGDNLSVGWRKPSDGAGTSPAEVIPGSSLSTRLPASTVNAASGEKGLVGWWKLDGSANDSSPYRNNGTLNGSPLPIADRGGGATAAYSFNGTSDYISVPNFDYGVMNPNAFNASWTLSIWAKWGGSNGNERVLIGRQGCNGGIYTWNNQYAFAIKGAGCWTGAQTIVANGITDTSTWHLLTATYQAGAMAFYADGVLQGTATLSDMTSYGTLFGIGSTGNNAYQFNGSLDDARVYTRALSAPEIVNLYNSYNSQLNLNANPTNITAGGNINQGLVGYWAFSGNAHDATPYRDNGTVNSATLTTDRGGMANSAYSFSGTDPSYIDIPDATQMDGTVGTWSLWFRTNTLSSSSGAAIAVKGTSTGSKGGISIIQTPTLGKVWVSIKDIAGNAAASNQVAISSPTGAWHHVAVTFDGNNPAILYIDGTPVTSFTPPVGWSFASGLSLRLGQSIDSFWSLYNGSIDEVRLYNRVLSASEVQALYASYN